MLDRALRRRLDPWLDRLARTAIACGVTADCVTWVAFSVGLLAAGTVALQWYGWGLGLMLASRLLDGLDGAIARNGRGPTALGSFLDITLDFVFYGAFVAAFALAGPEANALPAALLLLTFIGSGASFLAFASVATHHQIRNIEGLMHKKGIPYLGGLAEGTETIIVFALFCLFPGWFPLLAYGFAGLCALTLIGRIAAAHRSLRA